MFARNGVTKFAGTAIIAGALGLAAFAAAGTAAAMSSVDDNFLADITAQGIAYDSPQNAIYAAHDVCGRPRRRRRPRRPRPGDHGHHRPDHRSGRDLRRLRGATTTAPSTARYSDRTPPTRGPRCGGGAPAPPNR